jgi:hypothetical protein
MSIFDVVVLSGIVGGITGLIAHLIRNEKIILFPKIRKRPRGIYLGFLADILIGAAAAIFATTYLVPSPEEIKSIVGISILAGMSAETVLVHRELNTANHKGQALDRINDRLSG